MLDLGVADTGAAATTAADGGLGLCDLGVCCGDGGSKPGINNFEVTFFSDFLITGGACFKKLTGAGFGVANTVTFPGFMSSLTSVGPRTSPERKLETE